MGLCNAIIQVPWVSLYRPPECHQRHQECQYKGIRSAMLWIPECHCNGLRSAKLVSALTVSNSNQYSKYLQWLKILYKLHHCRCTPVLPRGECTGRACTRAATNQPSMTDIQTNGQTWFPAYSVIFCSVTFSVLLYILYLRQRQCKQASKHVCL